MIHLLLLVSGMVDPRNAPLGEMARKSSLTMPETVMLIGELVLRTSTSIGTLSSFLDVGSEYVLDALSAAEELGILKASVEGDSLKVSELRAPIFKDHTNFPPPVAVVAGLCSILPSMNLAQLGTILRVSPANAEILLCYAAGLGIMRGNINDRDELMVALMKANVHTINPHVRRVFLSMSYKGMTLRRLSETSGLSVEETLFALGELHFMGLLRGEIQQKSSKSRIGDSLLELTTVPIPSNMTQREIGFDETLEDNYDLNQAYVRRLVSIYARENDATVPSEEEAKQQMLDSSAEEDQDSGSVQDRARFEASVRDRTQEEENAHTQPFDSLSEEDFRDTMIELRLLSEPDRLVAGILLLRGGTTRTVLGFEASSVTIGAIAHEIGHGRAEVIRVLNKLKLESRMDIEFRPGDRIRLNTYPLIVPSNSIDDITKVSFFNYSVLVGIIKSHEGIPLSAISEIMGEPVFEIVVALVDLVLEGIIEATISGRNHVSLHKTRSTAAVTQHKLSEWQVTLMGIAIGHGSIDIKEIGKILGMPQSVALLRAYEFVAQGVVKCAVVNNKLLHVASVPVLSPLIDTAEITGLKLQVLGYLLCGGDINIKQMTKLFGRPKTVVLNAVYQLIGYGLLIAKVERGWVRIVSRSSIAPRRRLRDLPLTQRVMIEQLQKIKGFASFELLSKRSGFPQREVFASICQLVASGYFKGTFEKDGFNKESDFIHPSDEAFCLFCGSQLDTDDKICPACGLSIAKCAVCRGTLARFENISKCPHCDALGHEDHMINWVEKKHTCPMCKRTIDVSDLGQFTS